jgi:hypothetical protein
MSLQALGCSIRGFFCCVLNPLCTLLPCTESCCILRTFTCIRPVFQLYTCIVRHSLQALQRSLQAYILTSFLSFFFTITHAIFMQIKTHTALPRARSQYIARRVLCAYEGK